MLAQARRRLALNSSTFARALSSTPALPPWATCDPWSMSAASPAIGKNLVGGVWTEAKVQHEIIDPLNGEAFIRVPNTQGDEIAPFVKRMKECPRTGEAS